MSPEEKTGSGPVVRPKGAQRFRPEDRIRDRATYQKIYKRRTRFFSLSFVVYHAPAESDRSRVGMAVSRKIGNAVIRNRVKRRLREIFRTNRQKLTRPLDLVINARKIVRDTGYHELEAEFQNAISRLNRIYGRSNTRTDNRKKNTGTPAR